MFHVEQKTDKVNQWHAFLIDRLLWYKPARAPICLAYLAYLAYVACVGCSGAYPLSPENLITPLLLINRPKRTR